MAGIVFIFAGQGAQKPGMGLALAEVSPAAKAVLEAADTASGGMVLERLANATPEELALTEVAQPALFAVDVACAAALREAGIEPDAVAGFSLGEYAAHAVADTAPFEELFDVVVARAGLMAQAAESHPGAMVAFVRGTVEEAREVCVEASEHGVVEVANINAPGQVVISGEHAAVDVAEKLWKERGYKPIRIATSGPFHTSLMEDAAEALRPALEDVDWSDPVVPLITNVDAAPLPPGDHVDSLVRQITSSVRWVETVRRLVDDGFDTFVECGPGGVLSGLVSRIAPDVARYTVDGPESLSETVQAIRGGR